MANGFAETPEPPYYAVIFTSQRNALDERYERMAETMMEMAQRLPGCLGAESARDAKGFGITVSYWTDEAAARAWKQDAKHMVAQRMGREMWYAHYKVRLAHVVGTYDKE